MRHNLYRGAATGLLLLLAMTATPAPSAGQSDRGGLSLGFGLVRHGQSDLMASPLRYRGTAAHIAAGYRRVRERTRLDVTGSFSVVRLESRIADDSGGRASAYLGALTARWLRRVAARGSWEGLLGGQVQALVPFRRHEYSPLSRTELYGDAFIPLQVVGAHEIRLSPDAVAWQRIALPLAAVVLRSPYTGLKYAPDVELAFPGRVLGLDHALGLDRSLGGSWSLRAEWRTSLIRYDRPREISLATHRVELALEVRP